MMSANGSSRVDWETPVCFLSSKDFARYMNYTSADSYESAYHGFKAKSEDRFIKGVYLKEQNLFLIDLADYLPVIDIPLEQDFRVFGGELKVKAKTENKKIYIREAKDTVAFWVPVQDERARRAKLRKVQRQQIRTYPRIIIVEHDDFLKVEWFYIYENTNETLLNDVHYKLSTRDGMLIDVEGYYLVAKSAFILDVENYRKQKLVVYQDNLSVAFADVRIITTERENTLSLKQVNKLKTIYPQSSSLKGKTHDKRVGNSKQELAQKNSANTNKAQFHESVCLLTSDKMERIVDSIVSGPDSENMDRQIQLKNISGDDVTIYGFAVERHHAILIDVADFVMKDVSIEKSAVKFYTGIFTNSKKTDDLMKYFVLIGDPSRVSKIIEAEQERVKLAKQSVRDETNNESDEKKERENISGRICIISRADFISVKQYSEGLGKNITHKIIYTLPNMRGAVVKVSGIYYGKAKCGFISAVDVLNKDINWRSKEHEFCSGAIGGFGVQNPMAKMEYYKNGPKTKEILQREQTKISLYERRYDSGNSKKNWHSKINLSFIPADNVIQLYSLRCHCGHCLNRFNQDTIVDCTAYVNTKRGKEVPVTVQYCSGCGSFFMNYDVYEGYQAKYGALQFECRLERSAYENDMDIGFADTSFLSRAGYSVKASVSQRRRQIILKGLLDSGNHSKWEITEKISEFIQLRKNNPDMRDAIKRWEEDIAFVADYDADNQTNVGKGTFKQGGKSRADKSQP